MSSWFWFPADGGIGSGCSFGAPTSEHINFNWTWTRGGVADEEDEGALVDKCYQSEASARVVKRRFSGGATVVIDHGVEDTEVIQALIYLNLNVMK
jgi:hypothetical protein